MARRVSPANRVVGVVGAGAVVVTALDVEVVGAGRVVDVAGGAVVLVVVVVTSGVVDDVGVSGGAVVVVTGEFVAEALMPSAVPRPHAVATRTRTATHNTHFDGVLTSDPTSSTLLKFPRRPPPVTVPAGPGQLLLALPCIPGYRADHRRSRGGQWTPPNC